MSTTYQCCFCGLAIEPLIPDTGSLLYTTCIDGPARLRKDQEMFCHRTCLADRLHPSVHLYAAFLTEPEALEDQKNMLFGVRKFISIERVRDGGSFALEFESCDGNRYILFVQIRLTECGSATKDQHGVHQEMQLEGYDAPVIIDSDPAKRPQNTDKVFYSALCGPKSPVTWHQARQIIGEAARLAPSTSQWRADWMKQMTAIVEGDGEPPPGSQTRSIWHRPS